MTLKNILTTTAVFAVYGTVALAASPDKYQTMSYMQDIYKFSEIDWYGSAHTMGMGNAVTATGGDIATMAINPAGPAVAGYSQVSITPGISISSTSSQGVASSDGNTYLGSKVNNGQTRFILPNAGFTIHFDTSYEDIMKGFTIGFLANMTRNFNDNMSAQGSNSKGTSTFAGYMATSATASGGIWSEGSLTNLAWNTDMIGLNETKRADGTYFGVNEWMESDGSQRIYLEGDINQRFYNRVTGSKEDYIFNAAFNLRDMIYIGASLGLVSMTYSSTQNLTETASYEREVEEGSFHNQFKELGWSYNYGCSGFGVYGKFGIIAAPVAGLRLGLAVQTPTAVSISESYSNSMNNSYEGGTYDDSYSNRDIRYKITSPFRLNAGAAYTFNKIAVLSFDYEYVDYSQSRYRAVFAEDEAWFETVNEQIQGIGRYGDDRLGASHLIRAGLEVKPIQSIALRAGYNYSTCGTRFTGDGASPVQAICFGLGWYSSGSFFCDAAARCTLRPDLYYTPYGDYDDRCGKGYTAQTVGGPIVRTQRSLWTVSATIGWRF